MTTLTPHQEAALNYKKHISLSANAGSGKTFVLSRRYLEIALLENISLRNIAAITFTDKAAGELYKKIALQIDQKIIKSSDLALIKKLESLRRELVSANISTIHSFCINILREFPVEAGLDANFIPIDEILSNELIELSVEEITKEAIKNPNDENELKYLVRIFASRNIFTKELISLIKNRKNVFNLAEEVYSKPAEEIAQFFYNSFIKLTETILFSKKDQLINYLDEVVQASLNDFHGNQTALEVKAKLVKLKEKKSTEDFLTIIADIKNISCTNDGKLLAKFVNNNIRKSLGTICDDLEKIFTELKYFFIPDNHNEIELELAQFGKSILNFFNKSLNRYNEKKKENGYLDFEDILLFTQNILDNQLVRDALSEKFKFIMIDEYQDTNELQYNIFLPISDYLRKGNLFVVGDEKQSIYMFRDAELEIFDRTKKEIVKSSSGSSGKENLLSLPDSFRMTPGLALFTNYLFQNLFSEPDLLYNEVEHSDLVCARDDEVEGKVEILIANCEEDVLQLPDAEAELVAKRIIQLKNETPNFKWNSTAILCRKRKSFSELERSFVKYKIPFTIVGGKGFYQRQSIYDIYNYFSFLLDRGNDTALIGILRSPFFLFSDAEIFEISLEPGKIYWHKLLSFCEKNLSSMSAYKNLEENLKLANSLGITILLRKILNESGYLSVLASKPNSVQELANIEKLINLTTSFVSQGFKTLYDYVDFLEDSINELEDESQAIVSDESNSVRIMTIHQAKGLEYPYVFLFKCDEYSQKDAVKTKEIFVNKKLGLLTKVPVKGNYFSPYESAPIIRVNNLISEKKNLAEIKRLFYVAVTRAMDQLFISASSKKNNKYNKESFMNLLIEGLGIDISKSSFDIKSNLKFLKKIGDKSALLSDRFINEERKMSLTIPIIKEIDLIEEVSDEEKIVEKKKLKIKNIHDQPEGEIISATKAAVYKQCPLKYYFTYQVGFSPLIQSYKKWIRTESGSKTKKRYEFNDKENDAVTIIPEDEFGYSNGGLAELKGRIIHKILQKEIQRLELDTDLIGIDDKIKKEINPLEFKREDVDKLKAKILKDIRSFLNSSTYNYLKSLSSYNNEFEIYVAEKDYFLYGIIDKLVIEDDKAYIFDYKTDDITEAEISERSASYLNQLKFYSYIVSKLFKNIFRFELRLIYIKHPDVKVSETLSKNDLLVIEKDLEAMVKNIRDEEFTKNLNHCVDCSFALNRGQCIKE